MSGYDFNTALKESKTGWVYRQRTDHNIVMFFYDWQGFIGTPDGQNVRARRHHKGPTDFVDWQPVEPAEFANYRENASKILNVPFEGSTQELPAREALAGANTGFAYKITPEGVYLFHHSEVCYLVDPKMAIRLSHIHATSVGWFPANKPAFKGLIEEIGKRLEEDIRVFETAKPLSGFDYAHEDYDPVVPPAAPKQLGLRDLIKLIADKKQTITGLAHRLQDLDPMDVDQIIKITDDIYFEVDCLRRRL